MLWDVGAVTPGMWVSTGSSGFRLGSAAGDRGGQAEHGGV